MSIVENLVNQISTKGLGGVTAPQGFDPNDDTFEKLLKKAGIEMGQNVLNEKLQPLGNIGQPAGLIIEPFDGLSSVQPIQNPIDTDPVQIKDVDMGTDYFSNLLKRAPQEHKSIMHVAQKQASKFYNTFGRNFIEDLTDFAKDVTSGLI